MTACRGGQGAQPAGPPQMPPAVVTVATAQLAPLEDATEYVATLKSLRSTSVQPQIDGQITQILVKSGDRVAAGAPIAQIDPRRQQAAVSSQEAERAAREASVTFARQQAERSQQLFTAGAISRQELEQAQTAQRTAEADLQASQAGIQQQQVQLRYYTVTAPTAGVIGDVPVRVGFQVTTATLLTTIDQNDTLELNAQVPVERSAELKLGLPIQVLNGDESKPAAIATVTFISPRVDEQTQSILVKATVPNPGGQLRSSQYVRARIIWKTTQGLVVPVTAVLRVNGQFFAFVAEESKGADGKTALVAKQRAISVGPIAGDDYPVLSGIKEGDRLVVSGIQKIADGAPIAPQQPAAGNQ
ncbi:MAG TPA: efflux RND transporter periplasmic adaptor subunit [Vicinamibacterales bacterium]|jgi:RND family efflux transporter MFP subunit|nr:efflux RND transporter periplasmic adaptor subunit [Vicinamibacterales bacterium]